MAQSIKQIKNRIRSVENTKKVTGAMQMISVVKWNRILAQLSMLRPYALRLENFMHNLASSSQKDISGYFKKAPTDSDSALVLITSASTPPIRPVQPIIPIVFFIYFLDNCF